MSISNSIYIPRICIDYANDEFIRHIMEEYKIGSVSYIDFTPINKKPGFSEVVDQDFISAFVHFSVSNFCNTAYHFQDETRMNNNFWKTIANGQSYKIQISPYEYWLCFKNKNPIQRTMMNIHQVVENSRHLEGLIKEQAKIIQEQSKKIKDLEEDLERKLEKIIYNLL
jgi:hypothetical protein